MARDYNKDYTRQPKEYEERVVQIKRVSKKTKGGNNVGFTALVIIGDKKGRVGIALGKAKDVSSAVQKGITKAKENVVDLSLIGGTIPHRVINKFKSAQVLLMPAPVGSGIIAGGTVRDVMQLAGIKDISAKMLGSSNKSANAYCTMQALKSLRRVKVEK